MDNFNTTILLPIVTSLIASFIFYFSIPWLKKIGTELISFFSKISSSYSNYLYSSLPRANKEEPLLLLFILAPFLIIINIFVLFNTFGILEQGLSTRLWLLEKEATNQSSEIESTIKSIDSSVRKGVDSVINHDGKEFYDRQRKKLSILKDSLEAQIKTMRDFRSRELIYDKVGYFLGLSIILILIGFLQYSQYNFQINKINKFNLDMSVIRPSISNKVYYELYQRWALVRNQEDYKQLEDIIRGYLKKLAHQ
jgi:hypothetical protein